MKIFSKTISWLKVQKWYVLSYVVFATIFLIISDSYLNNEIACSNMKIQDEIDYGVFSNKKTFGTRHESYSVVPYTKSDIPKLKESSDSTSFNQQYGGLKIYFKASGGGVYICLRKRVIG